jgi:hypothetical protein
VEDIWWHPSKILHERLKLCTFATIRVAEMTADIGGVKYYFWQESTGSRSGSWVMINQYGIIMLAR